MHLENSRKSPPSLLIGHVLVLFPETEQRGEWTVGTMRTSQWCKDKYRLRYVEKEVTGR